MNLKIRDVADVIETGDSEPTKIEGAEKTEKLIVKDRNQPKSLLANASCNGLP